MSTSTEDRATPKAPVFLADRLAISVTAIILAAAIVAWVASYLLMPSMMMGMGTGVAAIVSSLSLPSVGLFVTVWTIGMVAMMFPAMIPIVLFYNRSFARVQPRLALARAAGTPLFLVGYLATYALLGLGAYLAVFTALTLASGLPSLGWLAIVVPGAILIGAGIYQFTPLKRACLSHCVSPFGFFATHSRSGVVGAFRMGLSHGGYCVGCCWAYMIVMLAVGAMSIPVMLALAALIALEKVIVRGSALFSAGVGLALISGGVLVMLFPSVLSLLSVI